MGLFSGEKATMTGNRPDNRFADAAVVYTLIKHVITTATGYHCGICRSRHSAIEDAEVCLDRCWNEQLAASPTVTIKKGQCTLYRCRFCKREFKDPSEAMNCATQCAESSCSVGDHNSRHAITADQIGSRRIASGVRHRWVIKQGALDRLVAQKRTKNVMMPFQVRNALYNQQTMKSLSRAMLKIASDIAVGTRSLNTLKIQDIQGGATMGKPAETNDPAIPRVKKNPEKKFYRDGAKYVCAVCKNKYFTKLEVESCWKAH